MSRSVKAGQEVWLVPTLPTAPTVAYQRPACEVVAVVGVDRVRVRLADGTEVTTSVRNIVRERPEETEPGPRRLAAFRPARPVELPPGFVELFLW